MQKWITITLIALCLLSGRATAADTLPRVTLATTHGNIVVEFRVWDDTQNKHIETALRLMPEEAHLLAKMLLRNANRSNEATAAQTAFAVSS